MIWVGIPNAQDPEFTARLQIQDQAVRQALEDYPDAVFVDTWEHLRRSQRRHRRARRRPPRRQGQAGPPVRRLPPQRGWCRDLGDRHRRRGRDDPRGPRRRRLVLVSRSARRRPPTSCLPGRCTARMNRGDLVVRVEHMVEHQANSVAGSTGPSGIRHSRQSLFSQTSSNPAAVNCSGVATTCE